MKNTIVELLKKHILEVEKYAISEKKLQELDKNRKLNDVEEYGITSSVRHFERLFILNRGELIEKDVVRHKIRKKDYGKDKVVEDEGKPLIDYMNGKVDAIIIVSSFFDTRPKGPHLFRKDIEIYS